MIKWENICQCCNKPVSKADIDFEDKRICLECLRKEQEELWGIKESKWLREDKSE